MRPLTQSTQSSHLECGSISLKRIFRPRETRTAAEQKKRESEAQTLLPPRPSVYLPNRRSTIAPLGASGKWGRRRKEMEIKRRGRLKESREETTIPTSHHTRYTAGSKIRASCKDRVLIYERGNHRCEPTAGLAINETRDSSRPIRTSGV